MNYVTSSAEKKSDSRAIGKKYMRLCTYIYVNSIAHIAHMHDPDIAYTYFHT